MASPKKQPLGATTTKNSPTHHRQAGRGRHALAEALGRVQMRLGVQPDEPDDGTHLSRHQRACARDVAARIRFRRSALVSYKQASRSRLAGPQRRKRRDRLLLQEARNQGATRKTANHPAAARLCCLSRFADRRNPRICQPEAPKPVIERIAEVDLIVKASGVRVEIGGDRAFYRPVDRPCPNAAGRSFPRHGQRAATLFMNSGTRAVTTAG